ncbi:Stk1 family PASTA domain-containing Ser/Thr kinase [Tumebacillus sp. ITR2]|uniref:non-specific serine/threonine protein kinase n=1 Tax=Tumebacillus amylolyticus TaxID=2801339 RepID=A0ABS1JF39_9BACL|nr:Stk1 family PASTA domain-containing Ser/Thr kinase [Tumebacillus amylolyticus]
MIGRKLGNRYEVIEKIGGGGMAVVYRALDTLLNRNVSIKVLRAQFSMDEDFVRRFRREAQAAASLSHPNVVNIYDVGVEGEDYYIVMEFVDGLTLKEIIQDRAPLPVAEAIDIGKQICAALGHAHENNIVHRDIKPHNILIGKDGRVKVTDFGIARAITSNTITQDGSVLGSVHYFSPEQARGGITDVKSDIYSLGVVLYEMVTGELPFSGETPISVALKHLQDHFVEPREINPSLPQSVENIILKSLAKDPLIRYQTAREMYRDLEKALLYPNVAKFSIPDVDEQQTIQMPAVGLRNAGMDSLPSRGQKPPEAVDATSLEAEESMKKQDETSPEGKKERKFWRPVVWLFAIFLLLGVGAVTAYSLVTNFMGEPDVTMPKVEGMKYDDAVKELVQAGLDINNIKRTDEPSNDVAPNVVMKQDQYAGKTIKANRPVELTVSIGAEKFNMPNVVKMNVNDAKSALRAKNFEESNITVTEKEDRDNSPGTVLSQYPDADTKVDPSVKVKLTIAKGVQKVKIPDVAGKTLDDAKNALESAGLKLGQVINMQSDSVPKDNVISTSPFKAGDEVEKGETVGLILSAGPTKSDSQTQPKKKNVNVTVEVKDGKKVSVKIVRNDSRGVSNVVDGDVITATKVYTIECIVTPDHIAAIDVYQDGSPSKTIPVPYEDE